MIHSRQEDGLLTLELDRPSARNALDLGMVRGMREALANLRSDTRVIVLESRVAGVFSVGMDLGALKQGIAGGASSPEVYRAVSEYVALLKDLGAARAPVIAKIDGLAVGGGVDLLSSADVAIASDRSAFSIAQLRKGIFPLTTSAVVVPRIGRQEFFYWLATGQNYSAAKARRLGLVAQVVPPEKLAARVRQLVDQILGYDADALRLGMEALRVSAHLAPQDRLDTLGSLLALNCQIEGTGKGGGER